MIEQLYFMYEYHNSTFLFFVFILSASIGSFLNVVIFRLPQIMDYEWSEDAKAYLKSKKVKHKNFKVEKSTLTGNSYCPQCNTKIPFYRNIPILGWFILKGKTSCCNNKLSFRYPFVELFIAICSTASFSIYGIEYGIFASISIMILTCLFFIDMDNQLLPDNLTTLLFFTILIFSGFTSALDTFNVVVNTLCAYIILISFSLLFKKVSGKDGMGEGDNKLISVLVGFFSLNYFTVLMLLAVIITLVLIFSKMIEQNSQHFGVKGAFPFGPGISLAAIIMIIFNKYLVYLY